jgi:hypothetical protein
MNEHLGSLALSGLPSSIDGAGLGFVMGRIAQCALLAYGPAALPKYDMNICLHFFSPHAFLSGETARPRKSNVNKH